MFSHCGLNVYLSTSGTMSRSSSPSQDQGFWFLGICLHGLPWRQLGLLQQGAHRSAGSGMLLCHSRDLEVLCRLEGQHILALQPLPSGALIRPWGAAGPGWEWWFGALTPLGQENSAEGRNPLCLLFPLDTWLLPSNPGLPRVLSQ